MASKLFHMSRLDVAKEQIAYLIGERPTDGAYTIGICWMRSRRLRRKDLRGACGEVDSSLAIHWSAALTADAGAFEALYTSLDRDGALFSSTEIRLLNFS